MKHPKISSISVLLATTLGLLSGGSLEAASEGVELLPPASVVQVGIDAPLIRYNRYLAGGAYTHGAWDGGWQITQALAVASGDVEGLRKLLEQVRYSLEGENCISANGGYPAQHERHMTGAYTILKNSDYWDLNLNNPPRGQSPLTEEERAKITLLMKATLIASAYTTSDASNTGQVRALDGDANLNRGWNPNFREGMFGGLIHGIVFFGGVDEATAILDNYDHEAFLAELDAAGLSNTYETFNWAVDHPDAGAPSGTKIEQNIKNYRFYGNALQDPMDLLYDLTVNTYGATVNCGLNGGAGINQGGMLVDGCEDLPNKGQAGMLLEFDSSDANGSRSSVSYAYDGMRPNLTSHVVVLTGGYWQTGAKADQMIALMKVGIADMEYKLEHGYVDYSKGQARGTFDINKEGWTWSFQVTLPLWTDVVLPYHEAADYSAPLAPSGLQVESLGSGSAQLSWTASEGGSETVSYRVNIEGKNWVIVTEPTITLEGIPETGVIRVSVSALDAAGNRSAESAEVELGSPELSWGGVVADSSGWVQWGSLGWLSVVKNPWIWSATLNHWFYATDPGAESESVWGYVAK